MKKIIFAISIIILTNLTFAQGAAGSDAKFEYRSLIDMQTAGILEKGYVGETTDILPNGVMILKLDEKICNELREIVIKVGLPWPVWL